MTIIDFLYFAVFAIFCFGVWKFYDKNKNDGEK